MKVQRLPIGTLKPNPDNPRLIKDDKCKKLVASIRSLPAMLELRPIVVNADLMVLGGNMRLKACQAAGLKEVPVVIAEPAAIRALVIASSSATETRLSRSPLSNTIVPYSLTS